MRTTNKYKIRLIFYLSIITVSLGASLVVFITVVRPVFMTRLQIYGQKAATKAINDAIFQIFTEDKKGFSEIVSLDKNSDGSISALTTDTIEMNILRAKISNELEKELNDIDFAYISIPAGSFLGNELMAGLGPDIKIKVRPLGIVEIDFYDNFEDCGINQTRHTVYITATADISVVTNHSRTSCEVSSKIPVCETVIVGEVPKYFGTDSKIKPTLTD